jgi:hypothetical protein
MGIIFEGCCSDHSDASPSIFADPTPVIRKYICVFLICSDERLARRGSDAASYISRTSEDKRSNLYSKMGIYHDHVKFAALTTGN